MITTNASTHETSSMPSRIPAFPSMKKLSLVALVLAIALTLFRASAGAQDICAVNGGRSTVTLNSGLILTLAKANIGLAGTDTSQRTLEFINFPITSGEISLGTSAGQILHSGGMAFTSGKTTVSLDSLIVDTLSDSPFVSALLAVNGKFVGRVKLFDFASPGGNALPIEPNQGAFHLSNVLLILDGEADAALNQAFGYPAFPAGADFGELQSMVFVPLSAPSPATGPIAQKSM